MEIRFKLNPKNEKDKAIIELLGGEYSPTETIKSLLYKVATGGLQWFSLSFGGYVNTINVGNSLPSAPTNYILGIPTDVDGTPSNGTLRNKTESSTQLDSDIANFFN